MAGMARMKMRRSFPWKSEDFDPREIDHEEYKLF